MENSVSSIRKNILGTRQHGKHILSMTLIMIFLLSIPIALAEDISGSTQGSLSALGSGYGIGRWPYTDGDVPLGSSVQVRVATTNENITHVILLWKANEITIYTTPKLPLTLNATATWGTAEIYETYNTQVLNVEGPWGVQAYYYDNASAPFNAYTMAKDSSAIRAISFHPNVIPEIPYGTIGGLLTMLGAFFVFYIRSK